jgi:hypothetical protein
MLALVSGWPDEPSLHFLLALLPHSLSPLTSMFVQRAAHDEASDARSLE